MYTSCSLCSSRVCFRGVWLIVLGFRQTMVSFAMIHSSRVDRVRSRHLGRIQTQKQLKCHQPISTFLDASTKKATNRVCSICADRFDVSTKRRMSSREQLGQLSSRRP